ncbi:MAG: T9SS type B sorting domain-containing protein, partial [Sphingobacteriaceae bacterium]
ASQPGDNNYTAAAAVTQSLTVNKALLTITATNQTKTYGTANPELTAGYAGFVNGETSNNLTTKPTITTPATTASRVGSYPINVFGAVAANYQISYVSGSLSVYPGIQTITFTTPPKTYGDPDFPVTATASSGLPITYSSNNPAVATVDNDGLVHIVAAGRVVISAVQPGDGNYVATTRINQQIVINKALLSIIADDQIKNYGEQNPPLTITYNGFAYGETPASLTAQPSINTTATVNSAVGTYPITVTGAAGSNYGFNYVNGVLTVNQIQQEITFTTPETKTYGDADFSLNVTASSGLPVTYISSDPAVATVNSDGTVHILSPGNTTITASQAGNSSYSTAADITQNLTVNKASLILTADDQTVNYGSAIPALTFHANGFVNGENTAVLLSQPTFNTTATATADVGTYPITGGDAYAANYNITYLPGTLTIIPAVQTITVAGTTVKTYGDTDFNLNAGSNTAFPLTYASSNPALATVDASGNVHILGAGTVTFTIAQQGNDNYADANPAQQIVTVNKASLIITADDKTRIYGAANPAFTVSYNGFVNAETPAVFSSPATVGTTANTNSPAGNYPITITDAAAANYAFTYAPGTLTISNPVVSGVAFAQNSVFENQPAGTLAGTLAGTSLDPDAVFTYTFLSGTGSADNSSFTIQNNKILTARILDYEQQANYSVLVRATNQYGLYFDQPLTIQINDVNEAPTLAAVAAQSVCNQPSEQKINLTGISPGPETAQTTALSVSSTNPDLFKNLSVSSVSGGTATLNYTLNSIGSATITITVKDNGGTANGGVDSFSQTFTLTANEMPVAAISSDKGTQVGKGQMVTLTAAGGTTYNWDNAAGIIGAANSATLQVRPSQTTTYQVKVSNASGCSSMASITINVVDDYSMIQATNIITPNGDGKNDTWIVKNLDLYPESTIIIFDKAGRRLLNVKHYDNSWDGSYNGSPLAEGTYYYVIDFGAGKPPLKGFITLLRNR